MSSAERYTKDIKLFTNDKAGKAGRGRWYAANRSVIKSHPEMISEWQVTVSSANAGGQKRDNQIGIADNHSAFGRGRVGLRSFKTEKEAENFLTYATSYFIKYTFLLTDEALTSLGKRVPDFADYSDNNHLLSFTDNIDIQLFALAELSEDEQAYIVDRVKSLRHMGEDK